MDTLPVCHVCAKPLAPGAPQGLCPECLIKSGFETRSPNDPPGPKISFIPPSVEEMTKLFPQLEIIALLGQGGMGAVYQARQQRLNRFVALKILAPEKQSDPQFAERFQREARALASLTHPNIVTVYDFGEVQSNYFLLMEFVDGLTLRQLYQTRKFLPAEALAIIPQICDALQYAHEQGIVHRDVKPENILLDKRGRVKIADFGIAKILEPDPKDLTLTDARDVVGTPHYMAPEQIEKPQSVDCRADIYSLGVVFYEMLTGELPLGKFPPPSQKTASDPRLDAVVLHALEKEPANRYQNAGEVKTAIENATGGLAPPPQSLPPPQPMPPRTPPPAPPLPSLIPGGRTIAIALGACVFIGLLVVIGGALWLSAHWHKNAPPSTTTATATATASADSNTVSRLLNDDQRLASQYIDRKFHKYYDDRSFAGWQIQERHDLEKRSLDALQDPRSEAAYHAICTLAAMHSTNALPLLQSLAFDHGDKLLRVEISNRPRWMSMRALSLMGDQADVPRIIHLVYHNNYYVRWSAQLALVRLTGTNFGGDWQAWGKWWNAQNNQPPFDPKMVHWWRNQAAPDELAQQLAEEDQKFFEDIRSKMKPAPNSPTNSPINPRKNMTYTLRNLQNDKTVVNPTDADLRAMVASLREDFGPVLALETDGEHQPLQMDETSPGKYGLTCLDGDMAYFTKKGQECPADLAIKIIVSYRNGDSAWKTMTEWDQLKQ